MQDTITQAVALARKGSPIIVVGVFGQKPVVDLGLVQDRELSLIGTLMYQKKDYLRAIELVAGGKLHLDQMVTQRFAFKDYLAAYHGDSSIKPANPSRIGKYPQPGRGNCIYTKFSIRACSTACVRLLTPSLR